MLRVDYKHELGYVTRKGQAKTYLHPANCLFAEIHHFVDEEGVKRSCLISFAQDVRHFKACLNLGLRDYKELTYHFNTYYPLWKKIAGLLVKNGVRVKLYYKEPKKITPKKTTKYGCHTDQMG